MENIFLASDHAGFSLKETLKHYLTETWPELVLSDLGPDTDESVDYPDYGFKAARAVAAQEGARGIIVCGSGIGMAIAANRVAGIRAALCVTPEMARLSREHNNANILALGARLIDEKTAKACVNAFLTTDFAGGRHASRVKKLG